jgi:hypothetical protein
MKSHHVKVGVVLASWNLMMATSHAQTGPPQVFLWSAMNGGGTECLFFLDYLQASEPLGPDKIFPRNDAFRQVTFPDWKDLDPSKEDEVLRWIFNRHIGRGRNVSDD